VTVWSSTDLGDDSIESPEEKEEEEEEEEEEEKERRGLPPSPQSTDDQSLFINRDVGNPERGLFYFSLFQTFFFP